MGLAGKFHCRGGDGPHNVFPLGTPWTGGGLRTLAVGTSDEDGLLPCLFLLAHFPRMVVPAQPAPWCFCGASGGNVAKPHVPEALVWLLVVRFRGESAQEAQRHKGGKSFAFPQALNGGLGYQFLLGGVQGNMRVAFRMFGWAEVMSSGREPS